MIIIIIFINNDSLYYNIKIMKIIHIKKYGSVLKLKRRLLGWKNNYKFLTEILV